MASLTAQIQELLQEIEELKRKLLEKNLRIDRLEGDNAELRRTIERGDHIR